MRTSVIVCCLTSATAVAAERDEAGLATLLSLPAQVQSASLFLEDELVVGASVSVFHRATWEGLGARNLDDVVFSAPGLSPVQHDATREAAVRGFSNAAPSGSLTRLDGMSLAGYDDGRTVAPDFDPGLLDKIEVVRGPASALYGSPAFLGLIAETSRSSLGDESEVSVSTSLDRYQRVAGYLSRSLGHGWRLTGGAAGSWQGDQDIAYPYTDPEDGSTRGGTYAAERNQVSTLAKLSWAGGPLQWEIGHYHAASDYRRMAGSQGHIWEAWIFDRLPLLRELYQDEVASYQEVIDHPDLYPEYDPAAVADTIAMLEDLISRMSPAALSTSIQRDRAWLEALNRFSALRVAATLDLPAEMSLDLTAHQWRNTYRRFLDFSRTFPELVFSDASYLGDAEYRRSRQSGGDLYLKQRTNPARLQWVLGVSVLHQTFDETRYGAVYAGEPTFDGPLAYEKPSRTTLAGLAQARWTVLPRRLHLLAGIRADRLSDLGLWASSPRAGVILQPQSRSAVKVLWGRPFRAPRATELRDLGALEEDDPTDVFTELRDRKNVKPDYLDAFEVVWMQDLAPFRYDLQAFYNRWHDAPVVSGDPAYLTPRYDTTLAESLGGEVEAIYDDGRRLAQVGLGLARARTREEVYEATPMASLQAGFGYRWDSRTQLTVLNLVRSRGTDGPTGMTSGGQDHDVPVYWRTDATVLHPLGGWLSLRGTVRNLLGRRNAIPSTSGVEFGVPESPSPSLLVGVDARW